MDPILSPVENMWALLYELLVLRDIYNYFTSECVNVECEIFNCKKNKDISGSVWWVLQASDISNGPADII